MKTIVLGDTHGLSHWKHAVSAENPDRVIFIGDYFDSFQVNTVDQINNFLDIVEYKKTSGKEVIMLTGNHDIHYILGDSGTSGYQKIGSFQICPVISDNLSHLQMAYKFDEYLFTHAGVSSVFMDETFETWSVDTLVDQLNDLFKFKPAKFEFNGNNPYGDDTWQTPIWIRPRSLMKANKNTLRQKVIQVVGHTQVNKLDLVGSQKAAGGRYYFIDCMQTTKEYLVISDCLSVGKVSL